MKVAVKYDIIGEVFYFNDVSTFILKSGWL